MAYTGNEPQERLPLAVEVEVEVAPVTLKDPFSAGDEVLLAESLRESIIRDLQENGPFWPKREAEVKLIVTIDGYRASAPHSAVYWLVGAMSLGFGLVLGPVVGAPMVTRDLSIAGRARLVHESGMVLAEANGVAGASAWTGLYYGREVGMGEAAAPLISDLGHKLAVQSQKIARRLESGRAELAKTARGPKRILAVLDIETQALDPAAAAELTDYLSTQIAARGLYRLVPRTMIRAELMNAKAGTFEPCFDEACQIELGKALAAEKTLAPRLVRIGDACALTATVFDLRTETTERAASERSACDAQALFSSVDQLVAKM